MKRRCPKRAARWWRCLTAWSWAKTPGKTRQKILKQPLTDYLRGELSDSRPAVITPVTSANQNAPSKPGIVELRSGAAVRSSALVSLRFM